MINAGEVCALVGPSGSGKSTAIALLERFYDPKSGVVFIDGVDIRHFNLGWLRSQLGLVSQESVLFDGTVSENILLGKSNAGTEEVYAAAIKANAHDFITAFPDGYDTHVGSSASTLSGGQRQRIAIARALVRNPSILLLDEATSALDNESEKVVQQSLDSLKLNSSFTTLAIAHRLTTIRDANKIAVVSNGRIIEEGTHAELCSLKQVYFALLQAGEERTSIPLTA